MDTQNTPVHIRLWHRDFWLLSLANMLLSAMAYMYIPVIPKHLTECHNLTLHEVGAVFLAYCAGLYLLGGFTQYLVQRYRRNVVCCLAILALTIAESQLYFNEHLPVAHRVAFKLAVVVALFVGALMGLAKMTLTSTLVIDSCESFMRTEANYSSSWFARASLALGPVVGIVANEELGFRSTVLIGCGMGVVALLLVRTAKFPFRAPEENVKLWSTDRYFLIQGIPLFLVMVMTTAAAALMISYATDVRFFTLMACGFLLSMVSEKYVFRDADLKSEPVTGIICVAVAALLVLVRQMPVVNTVLPLLIAFGTGIIATRFLLFFIKLSRHCQRGTSQSTYFLGWETGLALGFAGAYGLLAYVPDGAYLSALALSVVSLFIYNFIIHPWYMRHKNR